MFTAIVYPFLHFHVIHYLLQYYITEHGQLFGLDHMMAEMYARGPIACTIAVTEAFEQYTGGIFNDTTHARVRTSATDGYVHVHA